MNKELKVTDSGIEYHAHVFERNDGSTHTVRLLMSMQPARLVEEDETHEEYKIRKVRMKYVLKEKKKGNILWTPYPFVRSIKGMVYNEKNRELVKVLKELHEKSQEEELKKEEV